MCTFSGDPEPAAATKELLLLGVLDNLTSLRRASTDCSPALISIHIVIGVFKLTPSGFFS